MRPIIFFIILFLPLTVESQSPLSDTLLLSSLDSITVTATRLESRELDAPLSLTVVSQNLIQSAQQQLSLNESLANVPGLLALNADNFAQDARIAIRGFGARSAFGIRGIQLVVDGLPESTPDGQGQVDNIDPGLLSSAEVIRGPSSGLYGNAAGGVINFTTEEPPAQPFAEGRFSAGSYGFQRYQLKGGGGKGRLGFIAYGSHTRLEGYREHSRMESSLFNARLHFDYGKKGAAGKGEGDGYKYNHYKHNDYKSDDYVYNDYKCNDYKSNDYVYNDYKYNDYKSNRYLSNDYVYNDYKSNDYKNNDQQPGGQLQFLINYLDSPLAEDAGGLALEDIQANRRQAFSRNILFNAGEAVRQGRAAVRWKHGWGLEHKLEAYAFYLFRDFNNRLPFEAGGIVELGRQYSGLGAGYSYTGKLGALPYRFKLGMDLANQVDGRQRFDNLEGAAGPLGFDQEESFRSLGFYWVQELQLTGAFGATLSTRFDALRLAADDRFLADGDESGRLGFESVNPSLGLLYTFGPAARAFANVSTSFETPALSELSANPTGGGFNEDLSPQQAANYELGLRGIVQRRLRYQLALFYITLKDELLPFELEAFPGRLFYRNAGASQRLGLEASLDWQLGSGLAASFSYTFSDFTYTHYTTPEGDFAGNQLPAIPRHFGFFGLRYLHASGLLGSLRCRYIGSLYVDDANRELDNGYLDAGLRLSYSRQFSKWSLHPFLGANNLLDAAYNSNIRINAFGGRYYEPAAGVHFYVGVRVGV
ncbi:MAG: TonB-dependent receptor [Lewinellaceae bacterium]|nr:TonB-dependent receptor [Phaeodactylibacter sp.]MCB9039609.1 TonB-dependent receptor [Lewinellaceae bacterium]